MLGLGHRGPISGDRDSGGRLIFVLDQALWDADIVNFHPLTNTATTALPQADFRRFLSLIGREPVVVDFSLMSQ